MWRKNPILDGMSFEKVVVVSLGVLLVVGCGGGTGTPLPDGGGGTGGTASGGRDGAGTGGAGTGGMGTGGMGTGGAGTGGVGTGGAGTGGAGTGGAGTGGAGTGGAGTGGAGTGGAGTGGAGTGGAGTGGAGTGGTAPGGSSGTGGVASGGRGGSAGGRGGSAGGRGGSAGGAGAGGQAAVSYSGCSFVGGVDRVVVGKHDAARDLCVVVVFSNGTNTSQVALPTGWQVEFAFAVSPAGTCTSRFPGVNGVRSTGQSGAASWTSATPSWPYGTATVDVTLTFPSGAPAPVMTSELLQATNVDVRNNCQ